MIMRELPVATGALWKLVADLPALKWVSAALGAFVGYVFPDTAAANAGLAAAVLIIVDTLTGVMAAIAKGERITSVAFSRTLAKILGYSAVLLVCAVVSRHVPGLTGFQAAGVTGVVTLIILTEAISVLENVEKMGLNLPFGLAETIRKRLKPKDEDG